jgi:hypothetical protein|tara:strand:- start:1245 stop:1448 length:204 start_codon:yes stop_codon:yes gene_type:complete
MAQQAIKFTIKQDGTVLEEVSGVVGNDCMKITESIEKSLGTSVYIEPKPEFYQTNTTENVTLQHNQN